MVKTKVFSVLSDKLNDFIILVHAPEADLHHTDDILNQPVSSSRVVQLNNATTKSVALLFGLL